MAPGSEMKLLAIAMATYAAASLASGTIMVKTSPEEYYVELHNAVRAMAGAGPVTWDAEAARHAAMRAATACGVWSSRSPASGGYGENVFRGMPGKKARATAAAAMRAWTAPAAREYVQVVWPGSNRIGCAHSVCAGEHGGVISCSYKPAGN